jgi:ClpP class serine protease
MKYYSKVLLIVACVISATGYADTFKHKESGEVFTGFPTQKVAAGKTLVYNSDDGKMTPVVLSDYDVTSDRKGRRNAVSLLLLNQPGIFLSETVSRKAAAVIIATSNKGPQAIILQIDGPGGRGDAMQAIADAISQTNNCPIIAYIDEGAYSAAAVVALACDKVYIKSTAGIGAVGSVVGSTREQDYAEHLSIYNSDFQLNDFLYTTVLAEKNGRPELLAKALIDRSISVIEVANVDGSRAFVEKEDRQPTQTLIRTICEGMSTTESDNISPTDIAGKVLNLTAKNAVELGLVDGIAESPADILAGMQISEAKITRVPGIEKIMKKYTAARRNISDGLFRIEQLEQDIKTLSDQFSTIDNQLRTGTKTRETRRNDPGYRFNRRRDPYSPGYEEYDQDSNDGTETGRRRNTHRDDSQTVITEEPRVNIGIVYDQLMGALRDVVGEYGHTLNLVDRWPGGLPPKMSRTELQKDMDSASSELDRLYRYQPVYPSENQGPTPQRRSTDRRRY